MGRHSSSTRGRLVPALILGLTLVSVGSPLGLLIDSKTKTINQASAQQPQAALLLEPSTTSSTSATGNLERVADISSQTQASKTRASHTVKSLPTPPPTTTFVAPKRVQQATTATPVRQQEKVSTPVPPKPQSVRRTTTAAQAVAPTRAVTPAPPTTPTTSKAPSKTSSPPITKKPPSPSPSPPPPPPPSSDLPKAPSPSHQLVAQIAQKYVGRGIPYQMGGNSLTAGMDCSHFVWMVLKEAGYSTAYRPSDALASWTQRTTTPQLGDLVLFRGHVGIFVGNGKMIDQGSSGGAHLREIKYYDNFIGYGRIPI